MSETEPGLPAPVHIFLVTAVTLLLFVGAGLVFGRHAGPVTLIALELLVAAPALLYVGVTGGRFRPVFRLKNPGLSAMTAAVVIGAGLKPVFDECTQLLSSVWPMPSDSTNAFSRVTTWNSPAEAVLLFLAMVPAAAFAEELLFRGFIQTGLERAGSTRSAVFTAALFFTLMHANPWWFPQILLMGAALGSIVVLSDSVWPAVAAHGVFNLAGLLLSNAGGLAAFWYTKTGHVSPLLIISGSAAVIPAFIMLHRIRRKKSEGQPNSVSLHAL